MWIQVANFAIENIIESSEKFVTVSGESVQERDKELTLGSVVFGAHL